MASLIVRVRSRKLPWAVAALCMMSCMAGTSARSNEPPVKLSKSGICHEKGSEFYAQTHRFKSFDTMEACLAAGGRLPKASPFSNGSAATGDGPVSSVEASSSSASDSISRPTTRGLISAVAAALLLVVGVFWWTRRRRRAAFLGEATTVRRRWSDHRMERADRADEQALRTACMGNDAQMERLIKFELDRDPVISRSEAITRALDRWRRDIHRSS